MFGRRRDGSLARVAPYRRIMPFLMRGRNEAIVLFEQHLDMSRAQPWLVAWNARHGAHATAFHLVLHALACALHDRPHLNRFVAGRRIYDRHGVFITFAAKKAMHDDAPLATVKRAFGPRESFSEMVAALTADIQVAKSNAISKVDKELAVFLRLPQLLLAASVALLRWLDGRGLAPRALIGDDPMYTSAFVANLGSLKIDAAYHHLYEHGNCPLFVAIGQITQVPAVIDGQVVARPQITLRYTFDERVEDGHYCAKSLQLLAQRIEDPGSFIR